MKSIKIACQGSSTLKLSDLKVLQGDLKSLADENYKQLRKEILDLGFSSPFHVWKSGDSNYILDGTQRFRTLTKMQADGYKIPFLPIVAVEAKNANEAKRKILALTSQYGKIEKKGLFEFLENSDITPDELDPSFRFPEVDIPAFVNDFYPEDEEKPSSEGVEAKPSKLSDDFLVAPFSVFNAREGWWQDRKRAWVAKGITSDEGRGEDLLNYSPLVKKFGKRNGTSESNTSIFDPVVCEIAYSWFTSPGATVLDPFAGGSVRGITAAYLGRDYHGIDLRPEQVEANRKQWGQLPNPPEAKPTWYQGDSTKPIEGLPKAVDLVFSCPPYGDLEKYSEDPSDISTMSHEEFLACHSKAINLACQRLKKDRFAVWVVGDFRDKRGFLRNFVGDSIAAFKGAGLELYNEAVLVTAVGSLPVRVRRYMATRKLGKTHQNILVFCKGDPKRAAKACGDITLATTGETEQPAKDKA